MITENMLIGFLAVILISLLSFIGVLVLVFNKEFLDKIIHYLVAFTTGSLMAVVFFELIPEVIELNNHEFSPNIGFIILIAIIISFILEKYVHFHHHHSISNPCEHMNIHSPHDEENNTKIRPYVYNNLIGDGIHNFIDGIAIIIAFNIGLEVGIAVFLGTFVHEIAQEFGDFGLLVKGGLKIRTALFANFASALLSVLGAILALIFINNVNLINEFSIVTLSFTIGMFLYLSIGDLIPELLTEKLKKNSALQLVTMIIGIIAIYIPSMYFH